MASGDYYIDPQERYVEVHGLSTRHIQVGMMAIVFPPEVWPVPEVEPDSFSVDYVTDRPDMDGFTEPVPGAFYDEDDRNFQSELSGNWNIDGTAIMRHDAGFLWMFWDLADFPYPLSQVTRAELVTSAHVDWGTSGLTEQPPEPDPYTMHVSWAHDFTEPYGLPLGPADWRWLWPGDALRLPIRDMVAYQDEAEPNPYLETELFEDPEVLDHWGGGWAFYYAFPLAGVPDNLRPGRVGLALNMVGDAAPTQQNFISLTGWWPDIDELADRSLRVRFFEMPKLRLWLTVAPAAPARVEFSAHGAVVFEGVARLAPPARAMHSHTARLRRNRGG